MYIYIDVVTKVNNFVTGRVVVVVGASGLRSNRQAGSECVEHEPALPRVRRAQLAASTLPRRRLHGERPRLPSQ